MKTRYFILTTLAMALLAVSCQKAAVGGAQEPEEAPVPIQLTTNLKVNSVSVTKAGVDKWDHLKHKLYIYALPTNEIPNENDPKILVNNAEASAPDGEQTDDKKYKAQSIDLYRDEGAHTYYYYPADKTTLDFYGYYVGDAFKNPDQTGIIPEKPYPNITASNISLHLYLDGSQDIMLAKADKEADTAEKGIAPTNAYGAYSARKNVVPNLKFEHQLSRFVFRMIAGNPKGAKVQINSISLTSKAEADLLIATTGDTPTGLSNITSDNPKPFFLKPVNEEESSQIETFRPTYTPLGDNQVDLTIGDQNRIGESIMVIPADEHIMKISMTQLGDNDEELEHFEYEYHLTPGMVEDSTSDETEPFRAGYKYNVDVVIYGLQEVLVNVTLSKWDEGGTIKIDNDKEWGKEPNLGLKAKMGDSDYYLYFYDELKVGTEVKVWDQTTNKMEPAEAGTYKFDAKQGDYWYVTLIQTVEGDSLKTTVSELSATDPAATTPTA